jgi:hypothetical protein
MDVANVGAVDNTMLPVPVGALPMAVKMVELVVTVEGATPAPPPTTIALEAKAAEEAQALLELK